MIKSPIPFLLSALLALSSCISHKELIILNDVSPEADDTEAITNQSDLRIQPDDLLSISVASFNIDAAKPFNMGDDRQILATAMAGQSNGVELLTGYFVDSEGSIDFPVVGRLNVNKKTINEAKDLLTTELKKYLKDPVVNIRLLNLKVTVMGEVKNPGTVRLTNKRVTVLEAIGMAGDLTPYSNRTNVLVIREKSGKRTIKRLNLQSKRLFDSPYYYLQQNDVVYVEPNRTKVNTIADRSSRILAYVSTAVSVLTLSVALALR